MLLLSLSLVGLNTAQLSATGSVTGSFDNVAQKARYISHAGLEQGFDRLYVGNDPTRPTMNLYDGELTVTTDPVLRTVTSTATFGSATIEQTVEALFSADCFEIDFTNANYTKDVGAHHWSNLTNVELRKTCLGISKLKILEMRLLYGAPSPVKLAKHVSIDTAAKLYHVSTSGVPGYPAHADVGTPTGGAESKQMINPAGYVINDNSTRNMKIWWDFTFGDPYTGFYDPNQPHKIVICHNPGTLTVAIQAWENGHEGHAEDYLGPCREGGAEEETGNEATVPLQIEITFHDGSVYTSPIHNLP